MRIRIYFDGACNNLGNPPLMGIGVAVLIDGIRFSEWERSYCHGPGTNNIAEWEALRAALAIVVDMVESIAEDFQVQIFGDSQLIVRQFKGEFEIRRPEFRPYFQECRRLKNKAGKFIQSVSWVPRERNKEADELSKRGLIPLPKQK